MGQAVPGQPAQCRGELAPEIGQLLPVRTELGQARGGQIRAVG